MATNKNVQIRYPALDRCSPGREFPHNPYLKGMDKDYYKQIFMTLFVFIFKV